MKPWNRAWWKKRWTPAVSLDVHTIVLKGVYGAMVLAWTVMIVRISWRAGLGFSLPLVSAYLLGNIRGEERADKHWQPLKKFFEETHEELTRTRKEMQETRQWIAHMKEKIPRDVPPDDHS